MAAWPKISRGGIFEKFSARGGYTKNTPYSRCLQLTFADFMECLSLPLEKANSSASLEKHLSLTTIDVLCTWLKTCLWIINA